MPVDCHYCINRKSSNTRRARFTPQEARLFDADLAAVKARLEELSG